MKKVIVILAVMIAFVGTIFAVDGGTLTINASVAPVPPTFSIHGGKTLTEATGRPAATTISYTENPAESAIKLYVCIYQSNKAKFDGTATLTITASKLKNTDTSAQGTVTSGTPAAANLATPAASGITNDTDSPSNTTDSDGNRVVEYVLNYDGRSIQANNVATFDLTWAATSELSVGSYSATVTLAYTAQ